MKPYENYKETNIPWVEEIPSHWDFSRNKNVLVEQKTVVGENSSNYKLLSLTLNGVILRDMENAKGKFPKEFDTYKIVKKGNIIFCLFDIDETPRTVGLSKYYGMITGAYDIFDIQNINSEYLYYYYLAMDNVKALKPMYTGLRKVIGVISFKGAKLPVPPRTEQDQIVRFLDWKLSKINKLIKAKKKQIELLKEQKQAIINKAVTKGLDDSVPMKDSGVEWLGEVPELWDIVRCKYLFQERIERSQTGSEQHLSMSQKLGLIPVEKLNERRILSESYVGGKLCYKDDIVLNRLKAHLGVFALSEYAGVISPDYTVLKIDKNKLVPCIAELILKCELCRKELRVRVRGVVEGFWRLYTDDFNTISLPVAPIEEQQTIVTYLKEKTAIIDQAIAIIEKELELVSEYKTSLISSVVTGKVDVRDIIVPEFEAEELIKDESDDESEDIERMEE